MYIIYISWLLINIKIIFNYIEEKRKRKHAHVHTKANENGPEI